MCDQPFTEGCRVRIMPDVHAGKGCTIGTTMTIRGKAVPNVVGVDIGCGMYATRLGNKRVDFARVDEICHWIPSGMNALSCADRRVPLTEQNFLHELSRIVPAADDHAEDPRGASADQNHTLFILADRLLLIPFAG